MATNSSSQLDGLVVAILAMSVLAVLCFATVTVYLLADYLGTSLERSGPM